MSVGKISAPSAFAAVVLRTDVLLLVTFSVLKWSLVSPYHAEIASAIPVATTATSWNDESMGWSKISRQNRNDSHNDIAANT